MKKYINIISGIILFLVVCNMSELDAQEFKLNDFGDNLRNHNFEFIMPNGFFCPDSINRSITIDSVPILVRPSKAIISQDSSILVIFTVLFKSKRGENNVRKFLPEHDTNKNYISIFRNISNYAGTEKYDEKKIRYIKKEKLNADVAGEYSIHLTTPYEQKYNFLKIRFIQQNYKSEIVSYCFYKKYTKKTVHKMDKTLDEIIFYKSK